MEEETASLYEATAAEQQALVCLEDGDPCVMLFEDGEETVHGLTGNLHHPLLLQDKVFLELEFV